jgi:hypothetical protein
MSLSSKAVAKPTTILIIFIVLTVSASTGFLFWLLLSKPIIANLEVIVNVPSPIKLTPVE